MKWLHARRGSHRRSLRRDGGPGPGPGSAPVRADRAGIGLGPGPARGAHAAEGQLPLAHPRSPWPDPRGRAAALGGTHRAPAGRHRRLVRGLACRHVRGGQRSRAERGPALGPLPGGARRPDRARDRRPGAPRRSRRQGAADARDRHRGPVPLPRRAGRVHRRAHEVGCFTRLPLPRCVRARGAYASSHGCIPSTSTRSRKEGDIMKHLKKDAAGNRSVEAEAEVTGTPEEVWAAIATGPGVSSWFVPTTIDGREGGDIIASFGPGMDSAAKVTSWDPPRRFTAENAEGMGPGSPTFATEWTVEARAGGKCRVRVVHRWFTEKDDWDNQFEGTVYGWRAFFRVLDLYLIHFGGMPCSAFQLMSFAPAPQDKAWNALSGSLGLERASAGKSFKSRTPVMAGVVERVGEIAYPELLLRLEAPAPGLTHMFAMPMGGQVCLSVRSFLYGNRAAAAVASEEPKWQAWLNELFPAPMGSSTTG